MRARPRGETGTRGRGRQSILSVFVRATSVSLEVVGARLGLSDEVKQAAREAGFELAGITTADPLPEAEQATLEQLRSGMLEGMAWITEERVRLSCDPARLLPGARSVIVLGKYYAPSQRQGAPPAEGPLGKIARYAYRDDYHDAFRPRLGRMLDLIAASAGRRPRARLFVDSSPLAEKAVAVRSGIGWYGKNGCLLTRDHGSWVLLAAIVSDLELEPDPPLRRDCGRCRLCIDRCPTGAIVSPYVVDARRCISYLTIEHRGAIPGDLRPLMGEWVFGCDVCQEVCPHNLLARGETDPDFAPRTELGSGVPLASLLELDARGFKSLFRGSPMLRAKRRGLLRNAAVALGNTGTASSIPSLTRALADEEWLVRSHAAWALSEIGAPGRGMASAVVQARR